MRQPAKTTYNPIRNQISTRDQIKRVVDCHLWWAVVSYRNAATESLDDDSPFLIPRGVVPWLDDGGWSAKSDFGILRVSGHFLAIEALARQLRHMSPLLSSKSKRYPKLESDLPTHVRASQTYGTVHTFGRIRQAAIIITCVGVIFLFSGFSSSHSVYRSQDAVRNPAYLIKAKSGAIASENVLCSEMGVDVMRVGGNAVDAAVATTFCIGVVNMFS